MWPLPIPMFSLYIVAAYLIWYLISRLGLIAAAIYSKPGTLGWRQYILIMIGLAPLMYEFISSILIVFTIAQVGIDVPVRKDR